jgi:hypothetical protein
MKSKIQFDLDGLNEAVITARIILTDDVRDKVAKRVTETLQGESCLMAAVCTGHNHLGTTDGVTYEDRYQDWRIHPVGPYPEDCAALTEWMGEMQLNNLFVAIIKEKAYRAQSGSPRAYKVIEGPVVAQRGDDLKTYVYSPKIVLNMQDAVADILNSVQEKKD